MRWIRNHQEALGVRRRLTGKLELEIDFPPARGVQGNPREGPVAIRLPDRLSGGRDGGVLEHRPAYLNVGDRREDLIRVVREPDRYMVRATIGGIDGQMEGTVRTRKRPQV